MSPRYGLPDSNAHRFLAPTVLMYSTLLPRMKASPYLFFSCPLTYSSVCSPGQRCQRLQCMPIDTRNAARTITPRGTRARAPHLLHSDVHVAIKAGKDPSVVDPRVELHDDRTTRHLWCSPAGARRSGATESAPRGRGAGAGAGSSSTPARARGRGARAQSSRRRMPPADTAHHRPACARARMRRWGPWVPRGPAPTRRGTQVRDRCCCCCARRGLTALRNSVGERFAGPISAIGFGLPTRSTHPSSVRVPGKHLLCLPHTRQRPAGLILGARGQKAKTTATSLRNMQGRRQAAGAGRRANRTCGSLAVSRSRSMHTCCSRARFGNRKKTFSVFLFWRQALTSAEVLSAALSAQASSHRY